MSNKCDHVVKCVDCSDTYCVACFYAGLGISCDDCWKFVCPECKDEHKTNCTRVINY